LALIGKAFAGLHGRLLEADVREFRVDRRVFEELLRLDGPLDRLNESSREAPPPLPEKERL
jgi:hypothetical protein